MPPKERARSSNSGEAAPKIPKKKSNPKSGQKKKMETSQEPIPSEERWDYKLATQFIEKTLDRGVKDLVKEFRDEKKEPENGPMKEFKAQISTGRNRYKDVGCLDNNLVEINIGSQKYIHANYVAGNDNPKRFICTQGPLGRTTADFWYMVAQEKCPVIVMLCNFKEQGVNKCVEYFPPSITKCVQVEDIKVFCLHVGKYRFRNSTNVVVMRSVLEVCIPDRRPHRCTHLHWRDWPDRGVPAADLTPIEICEFNSNVACTLNYPIVVHCSAGIGRTGSFVLIDQLLEQLRSNVQWDTDLLPYLKKLRAQRSSSVQTEQQYLYVHQVMLNYVINFLMDKSEREQYQERFAKFTADYEEAVKGAQ